MLRSHRQPSSLTSISVCDQVIRKSSVATILVTNLETLVTFLFRNVDLGIVVISVLQNTHGATLGKETGMFE